MLQHVLTMLSHTPSNQQTQLQAQLLQQLQRQKLELQPQLKLHLRLVVRQERLWRGRI